MITQEALFDAPMPVAESTSKLPPQPPKPVIQVEPLGPCVKCGEDAQLKSPSGTLYCEKHGYCGGRTVESTALGIEVKICGMSVEKFVMHPRMGIWVCPCVANFSLVKSELEQEEV